MGIITHRHHTPNYSGLCDTKPIHFTVLVFCLHDFGYHGYTVLLTLPFILGEFIMVIEVILSFRSLSYAWSMALYSGCILLLLRLPVTSPSLYLSLNNLF
jgi:hypothetical protein